MDLYTAYGTLALIAVLFLICRHQDRKPAGAGAKTRLLPYRLFMMVLIVLFLAIAAHVVSLLTGNVVKPRTKFGM